MAKVFINYREAGDLSAAAMINRELSRVFGADEVFFDRDSIPPGNDFVRELLRRVHGAEVLLVVIGLRWLAEPHADGGRAIDNDADWVRREIAEAFAYGVKVLPVLVDGAERLTDAVLPADIAALARCQYLQLRPQSLDEDLDKLVAALRQVHPRLRRAATVQPITMEAHASDNAQVFQAGRDQTINVDD